MSRWGWEGWEGWGSWEWMEMEVMGMGVLGVGEHRRGLRHKGRSEPPSNRRDP